MVGVCLLPYSRQTGKGIEAELPSKDRRLNTKLYLLSPKTPENNIKSQKSYYLSAIKRGISALPGRWIIGGKGVPGEREERRGSKEGEILDAHRHWKDIRRNRGGRAMWVCEGRK